MPGIEWPEPEVLRLLLAERSIREVARSFGCSESGLRQHMQRVGVEASTQRVRHLQPVQAEGDTRAELRKILSKPGEHTVEGLADRLDLSPRRVRDHLAALRAEGYRVSDEDAPAVRLEAVNPDRVNLHKSLLDGDQLTIGLVSDTHLSSNEEALPELELAYDTFVERGIEEVWHSGDWTCGRGIFRTQDVEIRNHTFETQVDYLVANYPSRPGIITRGISGNHDVEGDFGKIGADPVTALANRRDDIEYLGAFSAWVELPNGAWAHLLHGKGGMSYAYSYKAQKLVDGYSPGRKPAILAPGHWHVNGWIQQRGVNVVWPGCFEWASPFLRRLGLSPAVGFWILNLTLGDDGSLVKFVPEWHQFWEGRRVLEPAAA